MYPLGLLRKKVRGTERFPEKHQTSGVTRLFHWGGGNCGARTLNEGTNTPWYPWIVRNVGFHLGASGGGGNASIWGAPAPLVTPLYQTNTLNFPQSHIFCMYEMFIHITLCSSKTDEIANRKQTSRFGSGGLHKNFTESCHQNLSSYDQMSRDKWAL